MAVKGIDVSNHQSTIDWDRVVTSQVKFAFIKATESNNFFDPWFNRNWAEAKRVGIARGAYHFARPSQNEDPTKEAYFFLDSIKYETLEPGDMVVLDAEDEAIPSGTDVSGWYLYWLQIVENVIGFKPLLYTGPWYLDSRIPNRIGYNSYPLWLAAYNSQKPRAPQPWSGYEFWQYTDKGNINGVSGFCDVNDFSGMVADLSAYGKPVTVPEPTVNVAAIEAQLVEMEKALLASTDKILELTAELQKINQAVKDTRSLLS